VDCLLNINRIINLHKIKPVENFIATQLTHVDKMELKKPFCLIRTLFTVYKEEIA
jgi:hypothetical protein